MLPYSGLILDNNYGIVKTETLFGFGPKDAKFVNDFNASKPLEWLLRENMKQSDEESSRALKSDSKTKDQRSRKKIIREGKKKCVYKIMNKNKRVRKKNNSMQKKYMMPMMLGVMAAKSILVPVALKALAFISAKGLMMGFFSTIMASLLSLKGMFEHSHAYQRKDDSKTQVEIIQVPNNDDHVYHDNHYHTDDVQRHEFVPVGMM